MAPTPPPSCPGPSRPGLNPHSRGAAVQFNKTLSDVLRPRDPTANARPLRRRTSDRVLLGNPLGRQNRATESAGEPAPVGWPTRADVGRVRRFRWARESAWQAGEFSRNRGNLAENADAGRGGSRRRWLTVLGEVSARPRSAPRTRPSSNISERSRARVFRPGYLAAIGYVEVAEAMAASEAAESLV